MLDEQLENICETHFRVITLLRIMTAMINKSNISENDKKWIFHAIEEVIYRNNPIPALPENSTSLGKV